MYVYIQDVREFNQQAARAYFTRRNKKKMLYEVLFLLIEYAYAVYGLNPGTPCIFSSQR